MSKILCLHSMRDNVGKTTVVTNIAALMVARGKRVCLVDADFRKPSLHKAFGLSESDLPRSLSDFLLGSEPISAAVYDITNRFGKMAKGRVYLIPAHGATSQASTIQARGYDPNQVKEGLDYLAGVLDIDYFIIDARAGLDEQTLPLYAITDILAVILMLNAEDFQGTGVLTEVAEKIAVPLVTILVNDVPDSFDPNNIRAEMERVYKLKPAAIIPHVDLPEGKSGIPAIDFPYSPMVVAIGGLAKLVMEWG
ncbi:MAG TPA: AAA family ATPase [Aggregatilineales bacterium]|nr:AAA family ATPase [Anaerolineales bacterium]HRE46983.1 AAA family ATPase [Aggregatilineales bacterium]